MAKENLVLSVEIAAVMFDQPLSVFQTNVLNQLLTLGEQAEAAYHMRSTELAIRDLPTTED